MERTQMKPELRHVYSSSRWPPLPDLHFPDISSLQILPVLEVVPHANASLTVLKLSQPIQYTEYELQKLK